MNKYIYEFPPVIKMQFGKMQTLIDAEKRKAVEYVDSISASDSNVLNQKWYNLNFQSFYDSIIRNLDFYSI